MTDLAVITPSYAPDIELCRDLNRSVLAYTSDSVVHYIITPQRDLELFSSMRGPRTVVRSVAELLPWHVLAIPRANIWLNLRRPALPVRGWVMQQVMKLQLATQIEADALLMVDSDVLFVRPVTADTFRRDGRLCFYRKDAGVDEHLPRHLTWHNVARRLLGIPQSEPPLPDYVSALTVWEPGTVRALMDHVQGVTGRRWVDELAAQLHFSEDTLYGVFVDEVLGEHAQVTRCETMLCHSYWHPRPLTLEAANRFLDTMSSDDIAVMISAKSRTPLEVRRAALSRLGQRQ